MIVSSPEHLGRRLGAGPTLDPSSYDPADPSTWELGGPGVAPGTGPLLVGPTIAPGAKGILPLLGLMAAAGFLLWRATR